jgi:hypothetical protein
VSFSASGSEQALLAFYVRSVGPEWLDESLTVSGDHCRHDIGAASAPASMGRAGRFEATLDGPTVDRLSQLARDLCALDPVTAPASGQLAVRASWEGAVADIGLSGPAPTRPLAPAETAARAAFIELAERCRNGGTAAIALSVAPGPGTRGVDGPGSVRFQLTNIGRLAVTFTLGPTEVGAWWAQPAAGSATAKRDLILVDEAGGYLGGVTTPARLEPGQRALGALVDVLPAGTPAQAVRVAAGGRIYVDDSEMRFRVHALLAE